VWGDARRCAFAVAIVGLVSSQPVYQTLGEIRRTTVT
jgi:hypothetical protein